MDKFIEYSIAIIIVAIFFVVEGLIVAWCWNYIMPYLFGLPTINYIQALVLELLGIALFKNSSVSTKKD